ncbi:uncharacterized protein BP5553_05350 [Venustampulla echinocandica]|uniref:Uncharacterized protein n=1 Tax=Venustampulla echinocandica TaxID=2656787 RepID=A0A370TQX6_9HELO|nr:uncharacterized protein BP5553_05350 [Venustampulla echinocandica]RDL37917.1 hypothetical protein BP5553_05350 [Venustampulla echinocandica]
MGKAPSPRVPSSSEPRRTRAGRSGLQARGDADAPYGAPTWTVHAMPTVYGWLRKGTSTPVPACLSETLDSGGSVQQSEHHTEAASGAHHRVLLRPNADANANANANANNARACTCASTPPVQCLQRPDVAQPLRAAERLVAGFFWLLAAAVGRCITLWRTTATASPSLLCRTIVHTPVLPPLGSGLELDSGGQSTEYRVHSTNYRIAAADVPNTISDPSEFSAAVRSPEAVCFPRLSPATGHRLGNDQAETSIGLIAVT